jgi:hypothetical protein
VVRPETIARALNNRESNAHCVQRPTGILTALLMCWLPTPVRLHQQTGDWSITWLRRDTSDTGGALLLQGVMGACQLWNATPHDAFPAAHEPLPARAPAAANHPNTPMQATTSMQTPTASLTTPAAGCVHGRLAASDASRVSTSPQAQRLCVTLPSQASSWPCP